MREKINKLAHGNIDESSPIIHIEPSSIEYELIPDSPVKLELLLQSGNEVIIKGLAYSDDQRVRLLNPAFGGSIVRLVIEVLIKSSDEDDSFAGSIDLVTNGGEISIPYRFIKKETQDNQQITVLNTIEDFAVIAEDNKEKALQIFSMQSFTDAPFMQNLRNLRLYRAFQSCANKEIALEQFIAACGYKINNYSEASKDFCKSLKQEDSYHKSNNTLPANSFKRHFYEYSRLRLQYDLDSRHDPLILAEMLDHLDAIADNDQFHELIILYKAEAEYLRGNTINALALMNSVSQVVRVNRLEKLKEYFLLEYLEIVVNHRDKASFLRLCKKFLEEQQLSDLFIYIVKLDDELVSNDNQLRIFLTDTFNMGVRSPWLYFYYCMLLNDHPEYLYAPKAIDSHSLNFGRKNSIISENITIAVISASCTANIKSDKKHVSSHRIYAEGIKLDLSINGLYEYYLYSLPQDEDYVISDKVLEHFKSGDKLDIATRTRLFANIVRYKKKNSGIYKAYEDRILEFALEQLKNQNINDYLIDIYSNVLKPEMITQDVAEQFLRLVNSYSITTNNPRIKSIVITYAQTQEENINAAKKGNAIMPIYFEGEILLFQDAYGNRYFDVPYTKTALFAQNSLKNAAEKLLVNSRVTRIKRSNDLIYKKALTTEDVLHLENEVFERELNHASKAIIIEKLISYYNVHAATGYNPDFLLRIDKTTLNNSERQELCNAYIICGCFKEAYNIMCEFGYKGVSDKNMRSLCTNLISDNSYINDDFLLHLSELTVSKGNNDGIVLDYLCKRYNGPSTKMYEVLRKSIAAHIDTHDMEERLIAQLIFINDKELLDKVFEWYVSRRKASESIIKAYFTIKCSTYFFDNKNIESKIFEYVENAITNIENPDSIPIIYILALTKYYSSFDDLSKNRIEISRKLVKYLLDNKLYFDFLRSFSKYYALPEEYIIRKTLCFKSKQGNLIKFRSEILPSEKATFNEAANNTFHDIYFKSKVLFAGETWKYEAIESNGTSEVVIDSGEINANPDCSTLYNSKYKELNDLCSGFNRDTDSKTLSEMRNFSLKEEKIRELFR